MPGHATQESKIQNTKQGEPRGVLLSQSIFAKRPVRLNFLGSYMHITQTFTQAPLQFGISEMYH